MKRILFAVGSAFLLVSSTSLSFAQEAGKGRIASEAEKDLFKKLHGYWVLDFDSAATKAMLTSATGGIDGANPSAEEIKKMKDDMDKVTFEIKEGLMVDYDGSVPSRTKLNVKSQDPATRTLVVDSLSEGEGKSVQVTIVIDGDRITMSGKKDDGEIIKFGLKRIDKEAFGKRIVEVPVKSDPPPDGNKEPQESKDGYPIAASVPDKPGFVYSPYNKKLIDVNGLPAGTLVVDPHFPMAEKKYFRVP